MKHAADIHFDKRRDAASYDDCALEYDKYVRRLSGPLAERICALARLAPGHRVLDVGTGPGIAARRAAEIVGPTGHVLGIDLSAGMVASAQQAVARLPGRVPVFRVMDAEALDLPDAGFDSVISLCAVRHFPHVERGLAEMRRVLKPGGTLVVSFGHARPIAPVALGHHLTRRVLQRVLAPVRPRLVGPEFLTGAAVRLLPQPTQSIETHWGGRRPRARLAQLVRSAGFEHVASSWWGHEVRFDSAQEFWEAQSSIVTRVRKRLAEAPPEAVAELQRVFLRRANEVLRRGGKLLYPYGAFYVAARRPPSR